MSSVSAPCDVDLDDVGDEIDLEAVRVGSAAAVLKSALACGCSELVVLVVRDLLHAHAREWLTWGRVGANASPFQDADRIPSVAYELGRLDGEHALASARARVGEALGHVDEGLESESRLERARRVAASWWMARDGGLEGLTRAIAEELRRVGDSVPRHDDACEACVGDLGDSIPLADEEPTRIDVVLCGRHRLVARQALLALSHERVLGRAPLAFAVGDRVRARNGRKAGQIGKIVGAIRERVDGGGVWSVQFGVFGQGDLIAIESEDLDIAVENERR